ncbi:MAG: helix-turn-helix transcriptional regulator [Lentisphaeria bacterium]|nr:helix-turn-helix transcriptional regulator [Lentisphaeria bacterium]NQZ69810.1 helix-turn-helix transcriptional regulator [Lentisphaeria bacterium]
MNLDKVLKDEMRRLARSEVNRAVDPLKQEILELKRQDRLILSEKDELEKTLKVRDNGTTGDDNLHGNLGKRRVGPKSIRSQRRRLGLNLQEFAILIDVNQNSIFNWEHGTSKPRTAAVDKLIEVRKLGRKEARRIVEDKLNLSGSES